MGTDRKFTKSVRNKDATSLAIVLAYLSSCTSRKEAAELLGVSVTHLNEWRDYPGVASAIEQMQRNYESQLADERRKRLLRKRRELSGMADKLSGVRSHVTKNAHAMKMSELTCSLSELDELKSREAAKRRPIREQIRRLERQLGER